MIWFGIAAIVIFFYVLAWAILAMAGDADEQSRHEQQRLDLEETFKLTHK